jgi:hypothetical protein
MCGACWRNWSPRTAGRSPDPGHNRYRSGRPRERQPGQSGCQVQGQTPHSGQCRHGRYVQSGQDGRHRSVWPSKQWTRGCLEPWLIHDMDRGLLEASWSGPEIIGHGFADGILPNMPYDDELAAHPGRLRLRPRRAGHQDPGQAARRRAGPCSGQPGLTTPCCARPAAWAIGASRCSPAAREPSNGHGQPGSTVAIGGRGRVVTHECPSDLGR